MRCSLRSGFGFCRGAGASCCVGTLLFLQSQLCDSQAFGFGLGATLGFSRELELGGAALAGALNARSSASARARAVAIASRFGLSARQ